MTKSNHELFEYYRCALAYQRVELRTLEHRIAYTLAMVQKFGRAIKIAEAKEEVFVQELGTSIAPAKARIKVGSKVAMNYASDATWFDVVAIDGYRLTIVEHGTNFKEQYTDIGLVCKYTAK